MRPPITASIAAPARAASTPARRSAFIGPHRIDARRCISYLTIEHDGPIPHEFRTAMGNRIYGCDDCLAVCPWNRFADAAAANRAFLPRAELAAPRLADLLALDDAAFREMFAGSPIKRIGRKPDDPQLPDRGRQQRRRGTCCLDSSRTSRIPTRLSPKQRAGRSISSACSQREDAGRLIDVAAGRRAGVDMGDLAAARRPTDRDRHRARSSVRGTGA